MEEEQDVSQAGQRSEDMEKTSGSGATQLYFPPPHELRWVEKQTVLEKLEALV